MQEINGLLDEIAQHEKLTIRISSQDSPPLSANVFKKLSAPHKSPFYFFVFVKKGTLRHKVDFEEQAISDGQLLFVLPNQVHTPPIKKEGVEYFKMGFDQNCLARLNKQFSFLINPLNTQIISFDLAAKNRVSQLFETLIQLLDESRQDLAELIVSNLNTLMTEIDTAYFSTHQNQVATGKLKKFIDFKLMLENQLTEQNTITSIAENLAISTNSLYQIVKEFSGVSPKEFIINRLILEAQRKLHYSDFSTKELAFELGFNDPDYFSRLFKKRIGKNVSEYVAEIQDL